MISLQSETSVHYRTVIWLCLAVCYSCMLVSCDSHPNAMLIKTKYPKKENIYTLRDPEEVSHDKAIIFVHGVFGDAVTTWLNDDSGNYWPLLLKEDAEIRNAGFDIYSVGFDSPLFERTSSIQEVAQPLLQDLQTRSFFSNYQQIYFIAHSMGGLIVKHMLVDLNTPTEEINLKKIRAVIFLATPSQGANIAGLARFLSFNPQIKAMESALKNENLLQLESRWLALLDGRDKQSFHFPKSFCAYETKDTLWISIVNRQDAITRCDDPPSRPIARNHIDIVKPFDQNDNPFDWVKKKIISASLLAADQTQQDKERLITERVSAMHASYGGGHYREADHTANTILDLDSENYRALAIKAGVAFYRQQYLPAIEYFQKAHKIKPDSAIITRNLADSYVEVGKYEQALDLYKAVNDGTDESDYQLGRTYLHLRNFMEAIKYLHGISKDYNKASARVLEAAAYAGLASKTSDTKEKGNFVLKSRTILLGAIKADPSYWNGILSGERRDIHEGHETVRDLLKDIDQSLPTKGA